MTGAGVDYRRLGIFRLFDSLSYCAWPFEGRTRSGVAGLEH